MSNNNTIDDPHNNNSTKSSNVHRALIFQGGGSLGAYEAGAYKASAKNCPLLSKNTIEKRKKTRTDNISYCFWNIDWCDKCRYPSKLCKGKHNMGRFWSKAHRFLEIPFYAFKR
jgi:hypothetical protein